MTSTAGNYGDLQSQSCRAIGVPQVHLQPNMEVSRNGGTPIAGWFIMENPIEMDDF